MTLNEFMNAPYPAWQDASATVWRAQIDQRRTVVVIKYADKETFVARATDGDIGITTIHRTWRAAAEEAIRLSGRLRRHVCAEGNLLVDL
jgi:hypothetical protein